MNPSPKMLMNLESSMERKKFRSLGGCLGRDDNYYVEYLYVRDSCTEKEICALAHSIADQVQKNPIVLVDKI